MSLATASGLFAGFVFNSVSKIPGCIWMDGAIRRICGIWFVDCAVFVGHRILRHPIIVFARIEASCCDYSPQRRIVFLGKPSHNSFDACYFWTGYMKTLSPNKIESAVGAGRSAVAFPAASRRRTGCGFAQTHIPPCARRKMSLTLGQAGNNVQPMKPIVPHPAGEELC
jgi:hypothetical protein